MFDFLRNSLPFEHALAEDHIGLRRKRVVLHGLLLAIMMLLSVFSVYNVLREMLTIALLDAVALVGCTLAYVRLRRSHSRPLVQLAKVLQSTALQISLILVFFLWALAWQGQAENFSLIWTFFLPVFVFMLNGRVLGSMLVTLFYVVLFSMAYSHLGQWQDGAWNLVSLIRFVLASLVMIFTCYFSELNLSRAYSELNLSHSKAQQLMLERHTLMLETLAKQEKLLTDVSHELRTPLSVLRMKLEALQDGVMAPSSANIEGLLKSMQALDTFISDLSQASKLDSTRLDGNAVRVALNDFLPRWIAPFQSLAAQKGLHLSLDLSASSTACFALLDEVSFSLALAKLLENSLRYTQAPGRIKVSLVKHKETIVITFEDSAPGVENTSLTRLFEPLFRIEDSRSRETGGAGLGLSVAKSIITAHQGQIQAGPSQLGGLSIIITLPAIVR